MFYSDPILSGIKPEIMVIPLGLHKGNIVIVC